MAATWDNRIVGAGEESPDSLLANPRNFRRHPKPQQDAMRGVLAQIGWIQDVIVNRTTGHLIDGHLRVELAVTDKQPTVPVKYVDLSPEEEALALATLDPLGAMAVTDAQALDALMRDLAVDDPAVVAMLAELAERERVGLPMDDDWMAAFEGGTVASGDLDTVNLTFVLPIDAVDDVKAALARFDGNKNAALVGMARQCLA